MEKKGISTSIFSFEKMIDRNVFYVDKTEYFYRLVTSAEDCYFCSRPRRFGKSLAISTLKAIFEGKKELFKGLYIYDTDYDWQVYPVIHLDMARCDCSSAENLTLSLLAKIDMIAKENGVSVSNATPAIGFDSLISAICEKTGKQVVILIDEYDKPLTENINDLAEIEKVRKVLDAFYQIIKGQNANERFVFMTGVTKFSKVSIFSKLNNLQDITMSRDYACMFGYTQDELERNFAPHIDDYIAEEAAKGNEVDREAFLSEIKRWYNGFRFSAGAETVYNPVSVGQFFIDHCEFSNYWFATGTPCLLVDLMKKTSLSIEDIKDASVSEYSTFSIENINKWNLINLLVQTGYLTIDKEEVIGSDTYYDLKYPNFEVQHSFEQILI